MQFALQNVGLLDLHVLMIGKARARRHLHQRSHQAGVLVEEKCFLLDAGVRRLLPRHALDVEEARCKFGSTIHAFRCSPTLTIFMVFVPPLLPIGSPMVSTMMSPCFTTLLATSTFSASCSSSSRSWPTYFTISGNTSRNSAQR